MKIDISGIDKATLLIELYRRAQVKGLGAMHAKNEPMTRDEALAELKVSTDFDYLHGRVMKVDLSENQMRIDLFDRDNGQGQAETAVAVARRRSVNPDEKGPGENSVDGSCAGGMRFGGPG